MIGNDIVDLNQAAKDSPDSDQNGRRFTRFLDKVFTLEEQQLISNAEDKNKMIWLLWSMKEAAYKIYASAFCIRFFNPKEMVCSVSSKSKGIVEVKGEIYETSSIINKKYIYTIAKSLEGKDVKTECFRTESSSYVLQSQLNRERVLEAYSETKNVTINTLSIKKNKLGIPQLYKNGLKQKDAFSMTHHGNYCAYVIG